MLQQQQHSHSPIPGVTLETFTDLSSFIYFFKIKVNTLLYAENGHVNKPYSLLIKIKVVINNILLK